MAMKTGDSLYSTFCIDEHGEQINRAEHRDIVKALKAWEKNIKLLGFEGGASSVLLDNKNVAQLVWCEVDSGATSGNEIIDKVLLDTIPRGPEQYKPYLRATGWFEVLLGTINNVTSKQAKRRLKAVSKYGFY